MTSYRLRGRSIGSLRLALHKRLNPAHTLVGRFGRATACGTCLGLANPENGLPREFA